MIVFCLNWLLVAACWHLFWQSLLVPLHLSPHSISFMKADCCFPLWGCFICICYPPPALSECLPPPPCFTLLCQPLPRCLVGVSADTSTGHPRSTRCCVNISLFILKPQDHLGDTWDICHALNYISSIYGGWVQVDVELFAGSLSELLKSPNYPLM